MSAAFKRNVQFGARFVGRRAVSSQARNATDARILKVAIGCTVAGGAAAILAGNAFRRLTVDKLHAETKRAAPDFHLYWASGSPPCWRVMIALEEKGLSGYPNTLCSMQDKQHKSEEILAINPRGQMPSLRVGSVGLNESMGAIDYFEMVYKGQGTSLYPSDNPEQLALVLQRKNEVMNVHKKCVEETLFYLFKDDKTDEEVAKRTEVFKTELMFYENYLSQQKTGAKYIAGSSFSMADVVFFPYIAFFVRLGLSLDDRFPNLKEYYERLSQRPSIQKTWPPHWKTAAAPSQLLKVI